MSGMLAFIKHLCGAMLTGFFFTGIVAGILWAVVLFVTVPNHQLRWISRRSSRW